MGSDRLIDTIASEPGWDVFCAHGAQVANYRSRDFDVAAALESNTHRLAPVLEALKSKGVKKVVATGSVFESNEGIGEEPRRAFSPYGLSKAMTWDAFTYWANDTGVHLGKFVIANPFGPFEEPRLTAYLMKSWMEGATPSIKTPLYVRDNIHISALACHYEGFVSAATGKTGISRIGPVGYAETQGAFVNRLAGAMRPRLSLPCQVAFGTQTDFSEPMIRINSNIVPLPSGEWSEEAAWDSMAEYYVAER
jgi:nucleoside-diphosphate-sugar epimerase